MRRSICYCEPSYALAGEVGTWNFVYTSSIALPKGTRLKFDLLSKGRDIDWEIPTTNLKKNKNVIYGKLENGKILQGTEVENTASFAPDYEFVLPQAVEAGSAITIVIGSPANKNAKDTSETGTRAQCNAQRRRPFQLFVDTTGKGKYGEPEVFTIDIRGNELKTIRLLTPSFVVRNKRFDIVVRFEDEYGNLTNNAPEDTLIELSHEHLRENLKWKLFVPETGFIALPNLYFNETGIYTIQLYNVRTKEIFKSSPLKCFQENSRHLFWGTLHGESERIDSTENIESCLRHFRDDRALNFFATSSVENIEETPNEIWKLISQNIAEFDEADRFVTLLGFQWCGAPESEGIRQMIYAKENKPILRKKDAKYNSLKKIYKTVSPKELISIPCFTMGKGFSFDFDDFNPAYERVVEIYNAWGSSECTEKEGNPKPISSGKKGVQETAEGSIQKALLRNCRFGFVAGGLDDRGIYSDFYDSDQEQYSPGLTAIIATEHTRAALIEALYNRSCYATTGERIIVGLYLAGSPMGSEVSTANKPGLLVNRHLSGYVAGTDKLKSVEIIRNGKVIKSFNPDNYSLDFVFDDLVPMEKVAIQSKDNKKSPPFVYYYLRVIQEDGHMAWSSPIWVDLLPPSKDAGRRPLPKSTRVQPQTLPPEEEEDEDDDEDFE